MGSWGKTLSGSVGTIGLIAALAALILILVPTGASNDLRAVWLAADAFSTGDPGNIYPPSVSPFTMSPPIAWSEAHPDETLFPYLYPPLWAALVAPLTGLISFGTAETSVRVLNATLLATSTVLAGRLTGTRLALPLFAALATLALTQTFVGSLALLENQPQIIVSFLLLLSLERLKSGSCILAGIALALAAALKVYPVVFALIWIATGHVRALWVFAVTGTILGMFSVVLAGWPLHAEFLGTLGMISSTVLLTPVSYALTPALAQILALDAFVYHSTVQGGWLVMALPPFTNAMARLSLVIALVALALALHRATEAIRWGILWPLALLVVSLLAPLSWSYHYIPAIACAPILLDRLGTRIGGMVLLLILAPISPLTAGLALKAGMAAEHLQILGTGALLALGATFMVLAYRSPKLRPA